MEQKIIIWSAIVAVLAIALIVKTIMELYKGRKSRIIQFASDEEMFFCPGDINAQDLK